MTFAKSVTPAASPFGPLGAALEPRFGLERVLGQGGMGIVYLARERALDRLVALKVLLPDLARDPANVRRFLREARLAARLRHAGIVSIHAVDEAAGYPFFTMEYVEGETLGQHTARYGGRSEPSEADRIFLAAGEAVLHAHRSDVVHRDLKPSNVMLERNGRVVVLDFGLAKSFGESDQTTSGLVVGTPRYMSPEQLEGKPATVASDVYALGLIYYFLLTGRDLVEGKSFPEIVREHVDQAPRRRLASDVSVSSGRRPLLSALLAWPPENRLALEQALERLRSAPAEVRRAGATPAPSVAALEGAADPIADPIAEPSPRPSPPPGSGDYRQKAREKLKKILDKREG